uniref:Phospholipase B-like n=1 Tax=Rhabditophanes sp. KR3021 TaxID=114890 RepID=A0AC35UH00_9BILA
MKSVSIILFFGACFLLANARHPKASNIFEKLAQDPVDFDINGDWENRIVPDDLNETGKDTAYRVKSACLDAKSTYKIVDGNKCEGSDLLVAVAKFKNTINETGWSNLEIETFDVVDGNDQAYAAGYLESTLSHKLISYHLENAVFNYCKGFQNYCDRLKTYMKESTDWIKSEIKIRPVDDIYWTAVRRVYYQLAGVIAGYEKSEFKVDLFFGYHPILMANLNGDLYDLERKFNKTKDDNDNGGKCSGLVKVTPGNADLLFSQVTMGGFQTMTRILKLYKFAYEKALYPGRTVSFSSYPSMLYSSDDFALLSSKLAVIETTINVFNLTTYNQTVAKEQLHCWVRSIVANQIARSGREWCEVFSRYNSGTYNNQWIVVDYSKFTPHKPLPKHGLLYVLEQLPGFTEYRDVTWYLNKYSYFASYNLPFYRKISKYSGFDKKVKDSGYWYSWKDAPRSKIFARDHNKVTDLASLATLMRYNDYTHDEFSKCECNPPYTAEAAISARGDLNIPTGTYPLPGMGNQNHGSLDYKGVNVEYFKTLSFKAWGGPAYGQVPAFKWSTFNLAVNVSHIGMPDEWNFKEIDVKWETNVSDN